MNTFNSNNNLAVWIDIPVVDLERAVAFYQAITQVDITIESQGDMSFAFFAHGTGNGGCLIPNKNEITAAQGIPVYLNMEGRIKEAVSNIEALGGKILQPVHAIGPHGFRAVILDSEGNRLALHSSVDG